MAAPSAGTECPFCGLSFQLHSNRAVRPLARRFLSLSPPFADCPDPNCVNHGLNVFEHCAAAGERLYRRNNEYLVVCLACRWRFSVGKPLHLRRGLAAKRALREVLDSVGKRRLARSPGCGMPRRWGWAATTPACFGRWPACGTTPLGERKRRELRVVRKLSKLRRRSIQRRRPVR